MQFKSVVDSATFVSGARRLLSGARGVPVGPLGGTTLKKKSALLATALTVGALATPLVAASPAGARGVKAAGPSCTARDGGTCTLRASSFGGPTGIITYVAHDQGGSTWTIRDDTNNTVLMTGVSTTSGTLTTGWTAGDLIDLSISGKGSIKATWQAGRARA